MRNKFAMVGAWLVATVLAVIIASAAVGAVRSGVTDQPSASEPFFGAADTVTTSSTLEPTTSTTTTPSDTLGSTTTILDGGIGSTTTQPSASTTTPSTTIPQDQTTTTTSASFTKTYTLIGGRVTISANDPSVTFISAIPNAGFSVDLESSGPTEVKVEFDSEDRESEFTAKWRDGELLVDIDESD